MRKRGWFKLAAGGAAIAGVGWLLLPKPPLLDGVPFSTVLRDRDGRVLRMAPAGDGKLRVFTPLNAISPRVVEATLFHEDRYFSEHPGVNPVSLVRAGWHWLTGPSLGGASTITMQVARLRNGLYTRSLPGKAGQIFTALCLERHYSKPQILEAYLNLAPYGRNIEGVGAASLIYFRHAPQTLSWPEAVTLSVVPQSPARRTPYADRENAALTAAYGRLYGQLLAGKVVTDPLGIDYRLRSDGRPPMKALHFTTGLLESAPAGSDRTVSLDGSMQDLVERGLREYVAAKSSVGVHNGAAMLVDAHTMEVLASVGSVDFWSRAIDGQVDGTRSKRSPGSALKPFIYALAFDQGLIHPQSLMLDAPRRFSDYSPDNFDRQFCGPISASEALARSRNVPAVDLVARLRGPTFDEFLRKAGIPLTRPEGDYGLSLALGGEELSMADMVRLYALLANGGMLEPLVTQKDGTIAKGVRMCSPEAAFLTLDALSRVARPDGTPAELTRAVCWKTGTSHGFRDAWSFAVFDHYVLAVWIGNFNGVGNPAFVGRSCAGPLLFQIIDRLVTSGRARLGPLVPPPGANLKQVDFCAVSGDLPGAFCKHRISGWFIPGVSPITTCSVHREVLVDARSGLRLLHDNGDCRKEVYEFWPSNMLRLFEQAGMPRRVPPPFGPDEAVDYLARIGNAPRILSPSGGEAYAVRGGSSDGDVIPLVAQTDAGVNKVHWFAGSQYLGTAESGRPLEWPARPGKWHLIAVDDQGRSASREVTVFVASR
jgi:penicillin-binding protein 1C